MIVVFLPQHPRQLVANKIVCNIDLAKAKGRVTIITLITYFKQ